jgi:hypothetical protein
MSLLTKLHKKLARDIEFIAIRLSIYYNSKRLRELNLKKGDLVYLL